MRLAKFGLRQRGIIGGTLIFRIPKGADPRSYKETPLWEVG